MKRLTEKHPTSIKLEKIHNLMEELGITISISRYGEYHVRDNEWSGKLFILKDSEDNGEITEFPPNFQEYKILTED